MEALKPSLFESSASMDPFTLSVQNVHYSMFRDHYMGQPSTGIRDNIYSITPKMIQEYHSQFYVGENLVVSAAGDVNANEFNELVNKHFGDAKAKVKGKILNL